MLSDDRVAVDPGSVLPPRPPTPDCRSWMEDWMISKTILALVLAVSALPFASRAASADPGYPGERGLAGYVREVQQERLTGAPIRIESKCFNACVVKLGATNVEIAPD